MVTTKKISKSKIIEALKLIIDPEVGFDIWTMGLIYDIQIRNSTSIFLIMTLTTEFCPMGDYLQEQVREKLQRLGFSQVDVNLTFEPPWEMPEELKKILNL